MSGRARWPESGAADPADLAQYPFVHAVPARFADVDSLGHLNNVAIAEFYEDARVEHFRQLAGGRPMSLVSPDSPFRMLLAELTIRYLAEAPYPATYEVGMGVARLGTTSVVHHAGLFLQGRCVGMSRSVLVYAVGDGPAPWADDVRAALAGLTFKPVTRGGCSLA